MSPCDKSHKSCLSSYTLRQDGKTTKNMLVLPSLFMIKESSEPLSPNSHLQKMLLYKSNTSTKPEKLSWQTESVGQPKSIRTFTRISLTSFGLSPNRMTPETELLRRNTPSSMLASSNRSKTINTVETPQLKKLKLKLLKRFEKKRISPEKVMSLLERPIMIKSELQK